MLETVQAGRAGLCRQQRPVLGRAQGQVLNVIRGGLRARLRHQQQRVQLLPEALFVGSVNPQQRTLGRGQKQQSFAGQKPRLSARWRHAGPRQYGAGPIRQQEFAALVEQEPMRADQPLGRGQNDLALGERRRAFAGAQRAAQKARRAAVH